MQMRNTSQGELGNLAQPPQNTLLTSVKGFVLVRRLSLPGGITWDLPADRITELKVNISSSYQEQMLQGLYTEDVLDDTDERG